MLTWKTPSLGRAPKKSTNKKLEFKREERGGKWSRKKNLQGQSGMEVCEEIKTSRDQYITTASALLQLLCFSLEARN